MYTNVCVLLVFLNQMLDLLRASRDNNKISLISDFDCQRRWFQKLLPLYNGVFYDHKHIDCILHQDVFLLDLEGRSQNWVYNLSMECGFRNCTNCTSQND